MTSTRDTYLTRLRAVLSAPDLDTGEPKARAALIRELRDDAHEVLSRLLTFLRATSGEMNVDVHARTLRTVSVFDDACRELQVGWAEAFERLAYVGYLEAEMWESARAATETGNGLPVELAWLNEATAAINDRNVTSAILAAWLSCEAAIEKLAKIAKARTSPMKVPRKQMQKLPSRLVALGIADEDMAEQIERTKLARNDILHKPHLPVPSQSAGLAAVSAARYLVRCLPSQKTAN